jgi:hypothetical protein
MNPVRVSAVPGDSPAHPQLQEHEGFACRLYHYRTINLFIMSRRLSNGHSNGRRRVSRSGIDYVYDDVFLQTWTHRAQGPISNTGSWRRAAASLALLQTGQSGLGESMREASERFLQVKRWLHALFSSHDSLQYKSWWQTLHVRDVNRGQLWHSLSCSGSSGRALWILDRMVALEFW